MRDALGGAGDGAPSCELFLRSAHCASDLASLLNDCGFVALSKGRRRFRRAGPKPFPDDFADSFFCLCPRRRPRGFGFDGDPSVGLDRNHALRRRRSKLKNGGGGGSGAASRALGPRQNQRRS